LAPSRALPQPGGVNLLESGGKKQVERRRKELFGGGRRGGSPARSFEKDLTYCHAHEKIVVQGGGIASCRRGRGRLSLGRRGRTLERGSIKKKETSRGGRGF